MQETLDWLNSRIGLNFRAGLERIHQAAALMGNPQDAYPIVHVTGTNGKGSTIAFMRQLFQAAGLRVGTFTSPHMVSIHDRICINGLPIATADFVRLAGEIQRMEEALVQTQEVLSYFEILTLLGWLYFREQGVDLCLLEVGIGGLLDTTNIVTGQVAVITSVGLDHQETLGDSLAAIAAQKTGIFKPGQQAVIGPLPAEAETICQQVAAELGTELYGYGRDFELEEGVFRSGEMLLADLELGLEGSHQVENAAVALEVFHLVIHKLGISVDKAAIRAALSRTSWPGRLEKIGNHLVLDGAHNLPAMERLIQAIKQQKGRRISILFGALKRKDYEPMLDLLTRELPQVLITVTSFSYDGSVEQVDIGNRPFVENYVDFVDKFVEKAESQDLLYITGSLYFIAEVRANLLSKKMDK